MIDDFDLIDWHEQPHPCHLHRMALVTCVALSGCVAFAAIGAVVWAAAKWGWLS